MAGNTASTSVSVNLDKTPPIVSITNPAHGAILQSSPMDITGSVSDALSGIAAVTCNGNPASLSNSTFSSDVPLVEGWNDITVEATDLAGNTADTQIGVHYTLPKLELAYIDQFELIAIGMTCCFWRPIVPSGFYALGHYCETGCSSPPWGYMFAARESAFGAGALARPVDYEMVFSSIPNWSFWRPVPPQGYVSLGLVAWLWGSKPSTDEVMCVREDLVRLGKGGDMHFIGDVSAY
jgi:hypothetical protein